MLFEGGEGCLGSLAGNRRLADIAANSSKGEGLAVGLR